MHLTIRNDDAHRLATELAALKGESLTQAVTTALEERLERELTKRDRSGIAERAMELGRRYSALPDRDTRTADEILGYDENGLPT
ncbi:MAG: type II toxin-antitoxin system VapB family antitoxin [Rhizobiaceae bacterium]|nr:type II toxin-antitoxin system VapB family antitoxin [Rhizobiaceae bacterium]